MTEGVVRPAWSEQFAAGAIREIVASGPIADLTPDWAWAAQGRAYEWLS